MAASLDLTGHDVEKLDVASGVDAFSALLQMPQRAAPAQVGVFKMRWKTFLQRWGAIDVPPYFSSVAGARHQADPRQDGFLTAFRTAPEEAREALLVAHVHGVLRQVLARHQADG